MVLVWQIVDDLPNSPNFAPIKLYHYTVFFLPAMLVVLTYTYMCVDDCVTLTILEIKNRDSTMHAGYQINELY